MSLNSLKEQLHKCCVEYVRSQATVAEDAIRCVQLSANEETKSSAGDKYETGRAMAQLEIEKNTEQLAEARRLMQVMEQIRDTVSPSVRSGNLAITSQGNFYLAISGGPFVIDNKTYFAISPASPIGQKLMGLCKMDSFTFNNKTFKVLDVL